MFKSQCLRMRFSIIVLAGYTAIGALPAAPASAASTIYYCPDRQRDQQYSPTPGPGCVPLIDKKGSATEETLGDTPQREYHIDNLQHDVSAFLNRYRKFLECCKTDLHELRDVEDLADEVNQLLISVQTNLSNHALASKAIMLRELLSRVAKARADLKTLRPGLRRSATSRGSANSSTSKRRAANRNESGNWKSRSNETSAPRYCQAAQ